MMHTITFIAVRAALVVTFLLTACGGGGNGASATDAPNASTSTDAYSPPTKHPVDFCINNNYPPQWVWQQDSTIVQPRSATNGQPLIKHIRAGQIIAIYSQLSGDRSAPNNIDGHDARVGPFRRNVYTQWKDGDIFEIYPAIYEGLNQQIYIGPNTKNDETYRAGEFQIPKNIIIRGITINGVRPVIKLPVEGASNATLGQGLIYIDKSENITIENIEILTNEYNKGYTGKAAIYLNGGKNITLKNIRIDGFKNKSANGIFGTPNNSGFLLLENIELSNNGGGGGPEHNIYINASGTDNNFTVKMLGSWSHDSYYGHLFKSRAQINILEGNYFQGSRSISGELRESWLLDIPEGGTLIARNNIFAKNFSGDNTNGASITFGVEKKINQFDLNRPWKLNIEHNTFITFSRYYDNLKHEIYPMFLNKNSPIDASNLKIKNNVFVGYCQTASKNIDEISYMGENYLMLNFNEIDQNFRPRKPVMNTESKILGSQQYQHQQQTITRKSKAIGAKD